MVEDVLKCWMPAWDSIHSASLQRYEFTLLSPWHTSDLFTICSSEVSLLWHNKLNLEANSTDGTLGELYDKHSQLPNSEVFLTIPSKLKGAVKAPAVAFLFVIDMDAVSVIETTDVLR